MTSIGESIFTSCTLLTNIIVETDNPNFSNDENGVLFNKDKTELYQYPKGNTRTNYTIPSSVKKILYESFYECSSLSEITIPSSVTTIEDRSFWKCTSLTSITIPSSVRSMGYEVFSGCSSLTSVIFEGTTEPSPCYTDVFNSCPSSLTFSFPNCYTDSYFCNKPVTPVPCT